jgi:hypothetical protein
VAIQQRILLTPAVGGGTHVRWDVSFDASGLYARAITGIISTSVPKALTRIMGLVRAAR